MLYNQCVKELNNQNNIQNTDEKMQNETNFYNCYDPYLLNTKVSQQTNLFENQILIKNQKQKMSLG